MGYSILDECDVVAGNGWSCRIDGKYVHCTVQQGTNYLPGFPTRWRVSVYQGEAQGADKLFDTETAARQAYSALLAHPCPNPDVLVSAYGFEYNH